LTPFRFKLQNGIKKIVLIVEIRIAEIPVFNKVLIETDP